MRNEYSVLTCQPPTASSSHAGIPLNNVFPLPIGISTTAFAEMVCRASKSEGPRKALGLKASCSPVPPVATPEREVSDDDPLSSACDHV